MSCPSRYRDGQVLDVTNRTKYGGGTPDQPSLLIKSASREDGGKYACILENDIGSSTLDNFARLNVICKSIFITTIDNFTDLIFLI